ncbi:Glutamine amidotransferase class-I [Candidatus Pantoea varia]|uniref:CTP synthase (glutamine hydrolyzing) n=1 Tax=Candidatus Pantoea varia TaxID=1881036 RepID=A0A1I4YHP1_9GAMM|nr:CTP synthase [Pantoea varia]SFN37545.1 Glutamine amidotransferase class-I [Pantoea varia]
MSSPLCLSLVGDYRANAVAHQAIPLAIERAARRLNLIVEAEWIATDQLDQTDLTRSDAVWVVPGSPYLNDEGVFETLRWARESGKPFLGSCGGFQYAVIEYARNVLGWHDASHAETDTGGRMVIAPLSCSLVEQRGRVRFDAESRIAQAYGVLESDEGYHCNFGVNPDFSDALGDNTLRITAWDEAGDVRGVELRNHPFYVATLFQSERAALQDKESPLVIAWMQAALGQR